MKCDVVFPGLIKFYSKELSIFLFLIISISLYSQPKSLLESATIEDVKFVEIRSHEGMVEELLQVTPNKIYFSSNLPEQFSIKSKEKIKGGDQYRIFGIDPEGDYKIQLGDQFFIPIKASEGSFSFFSGNKDLLVTINSEFGKKKRSILGIRNYVSEYGMWKNKSFPFFDTMTVPAKDPFFSKDKKQLFFSAKLFDSFGGYDLYYTEFKDGVWTYPKNLGADINSESDDEKPFVDFEGNLFFISNREGSKDLFLKTGKQAKKLEALSTDMDENGFYYDPVKQEGYVSKTAKSLSIVSKFQIPFPACEVPDTLKLETLCYEFEEETAVGVPEDKEIGYQWDFGDGTKVNGNKVEHCFGKTGNYLVMLNVIDKVTGTIFYNQSEYELNVNYENKIKYEVNLKSDSSFVLSWKEGEKENLMNRNCILREDKMSEFFKENQLVLPRKFTPFRVVHYLKSGQVCTFVNEELIVKAMEGGKLSGSTTELSNRAPSIEEKVEINEIFGEGEKKVMAADSKFNYKINLGESDKYYPDLLEDYEIKKDLEMILDSGNRISYYVGNYDKISDAVNPTRELFKKGLTTAEIVSFKDGKPEYLSKTIKDKSMDLLVISDGFDLHFSFYYDKNIAVLRDKELVEFRQFMSNAKGKKLYFQVNSYTDYTGTELANEKLAKARNKIVIDLLTSEFNAKDSDVGRKTKNNSPRFAKRGEPLDNQQMRRTDVYIRYIK